MSFLSQSVESPEFPLLESPDYRIAVVPNHPAGLQNRIFARDLVVNQGWMDAGIQLHQEATARNIEISTIDLIPSSAADVILFIDLPENRSVVERIKSENHLARLVLLLYESPAVKPQAFNRRNHSLFDAVITYNPQLVDGRFYHHFLLPVGFPPEDFPNPAFGERRLCLMMNTNYYTSPWDLSRPWHWFRRYYQPIQNGWCLGFREMLKHHKGMLYHRRRTFARAAEQTFPDSSDVFGGNWQGLASGWFRKFVKEPPYQNYRGSFAADKMTLLQNYRFAFCYENYSSNEGYISEKIFDALYAGVVPVYLGDTRVQDYIPPSCFVDARAFKNDIEILHHLGSVPEDAWTKMREAGKAFVQSHEGSLFQPRYYANTLMDILTREAKLATTGRCLEPRPVDSL